MREKSSCLGPPSRDHPDRQGTRGASPRRDTVLRWGSQPATRPDNAVGEAESIGVGPCRVSARSRSRSLQKDATVLAGGETQYTLTLQRDCDSARSPSPRLAPRPGSLSVTHISRPEDAYPRRGPRTRADGRVAGRGGDGGDGGPRVIGQAETPWYLTIGSSFVRPAADARRPTGRPARPSPRPGFRDGTRPIPEARVDLPTPSIADPLWRNQWRQTPSDLPPFLHAA